MAKSLLDIILKSILDEVWVGKHGEKLTARELQFVKMFGRKGKTLRNVYIPKDNGETSEIDVMYITQKGIFVFESKNYSGWIFGDEKSQYWTAMLPNRQKNKFYNPIKQNRTHIKCLQKYVGDDVPLFSIIVFSERCELKKIEVYSEDVKVIKRDKTYATVKDIWDKHEDAVEDIDIIYDKLKALTNVDQAVKDAHIADIEKKYKKPVDYKEQNDSKQSSTPNTSDDFGEDGVLIEKPGDGEENTIALNPAVEALDQAVVTSEEKLICPKCGKELVLRTAKKGSNSGNNFYGCSGFPKCRYVRNI